MANIVITGGSAGIGAALGELLARRGDAVALVARREKELREAAARCGPGVLAIVADCTRRAEVRRAVAEAIAGLGHIDVWVNNAGRGISRNPTELTDDDLDEMFTVNVKSAFYGMQEVLPHFRSRGAGQIVNISTMLGRIPFFVPRAAYSASKHFLNALTANFRDELRASHPGIQVTLVSPGVVRTDFGLNAMHGGVDSRTLPESQSAEEVAAIIARAIDSRAADVYTPANGRERVIQYYSTLGAGA
ncbi:MAG TPA: SDR family oxidoreductase [Gemmatimonadaceae bacterium]|nr:SDR family oxidoreductase [Gemmatimonadaceae bacterium]